MLSKDGTKKLAEMRKLEPTIKPITLQFTYRMVMVQSSYFIFPPLGTTQFCSKAVAFDRDKDKKQKI